MTSDRPPGSGDLPRGRLGEDPLGRDLEGLVRISVLAAISGVAVGIVGGYFRLLLIDADGWRADLLDFAHRLPGPGWLITMAVVVACVIAARLISLRVPRSAGSGIQDVEAVWREEDPVTSWEILPAKFSGGLLAIGSGLALGREGPTVHLGAAIGAQAGRLFRVSARDLRILQTALGGAGLGVAFNAPVGGALFVFEEVTKSIRLRLGLVTLVATSTAIATSWAILGNRPDFQVASIAAPAGWAILVFVAFGIVTGMVGVGYNRLIMWFLALSDRAQRVPPIVQAGMIGAVVGLMLWLDPRVATGGGDALTQGVLGGGIALTGIVTYFLVRFFLGPVSYAAQTAGGLFSPLLAVGALWGAAVHGLAGHLISGPGMTLQAFAVVGMASLFAAVVRAPFTGIVLVVEMTAITSLVVPMLAAAFGAVITASLLRNEPIYDSLRGRMLLETAPSGL